MCRSPQRLRTSFLTATRESWCQNGAFDNAMVFSNLIARTQGRLAKRARYRRLVSEIEGLSDQRPRGPPADRGEMLCQACRSVYG